MKLKVITGIVLTLFLMGILSLAFGIQPVKASGTICIRADGSVYPPTVPISSVDNVTYIFTDNIYYDSIVVEKDNIIIDGAGYTVQGTEVYESKGINLAGKSNVTIKNTEIKAFDYGVYLNNSSRNSISKNNITANDWYGISLIRSSNNTICANNIIANNQFGIELWESSNNSISVNNIENNGCGIKLHGSSNNSISGNNIANNGAGIRLAYSSGNSVSGNNITANRHEGLNLEFSSNNFIYHNNFTNKYQVYDEAWPLPWLSPSRNVWDDSYPSGGNYWSNYAGVDVKNGPNQDQPGSDEIGDAAHIIDAYNRDRYPLMYPRSAPPPPSYNLTIYSSPTGVTFTVDDVSRTTPWSGTYSEGASISLVMSEIYNGCVWSHWLEDGHTNRTRTVTINTNITLTGVLLDLVSPIANAGPDQTVDVGTVVTFDGSGSTDNVGITKYTWSFDDTGTLVTLLGVNPTYIFSTPGNYTVTLNVTDTAGNSDTDTVNIIVEPVHVEFPWWIVGVIIVVGIVVVCFLTITKLGTAWPSKKMRPYAPP